jgi:lysine-N-methylase
MARYATADGYGKRIMESIEPAGFCGETPHFRLAENERCPHLDERGLCKIITELGEGYLCHICREHPRFYNDTPYGKEVGLGMACEEAAMLILSSDGYVNIEEIGETEGESEEFFFDSIKEREKIYSILSDRSVSYDQRLFEIAEKYGISLASVSNETIETLEYLGGSHKKLFSAFSCDINTPENIEKQLERALAYFIYRHCTETWDIDEFRAALGFCLFCERLVASVAPLCENVFAAAQIVSEEIEYSEDNTETIKSEFFFSKKEV